MDESKKQIFFCSTDSCYKCRLIKPLIKEEMQQYPNIEFREVEDLELLKAINVSVVPTVIAMKCEGEVERLEDLHPIKEYYRMIKDLSDNNYD